jgi:diguanylate cyclase (GGDEF)-like protein
MIGHWAPAAANAAAALTGGLAALDADWPQSWEMEHRAHLHLLAAIAGQDQAAFTLPLLVPTPGVAPTLVVAFGQAIRADRAADPDRAARLADGLAGRLGFFAPPSTRLLCMSIAARQPGTPAAAAEYADELATLRWDSRLDQVAGLRDAIAVERQRRDHEQLRQQVLVDELTGLANRRGYRAYLNALLSPATTDPVEYAVMMVDVDHFKGVNDRFGHDVGDRVLARAAAVMQAHVRASDVVARTGGEEFVVVMPATGEPDAVACAERVRGALVAEPWEAIAPGLVVTASIGVVSAQSDAVEALVRMADQRLYAAKSAGRNRVDAHSLIS